MIKFYENNKKYIQLSIFIIVFIVYALWTFKLALLSGRVPNKDEAHAWNIAGHLDIIQIINLMKYEGHFLLWYILLKPFATNNLFYPSYMELLNWGFAIGIILLIWLKSPFSTITKIAITFSTPFIKLYPVYSRCYTIGIFFLFLSMSFYEKRFEGKYSYLYLLSLVLCANTNLMMCVISCALAAFYLYEVFAKKAKLKLIVTVIITYILNIILWFFQFFNVETPSYTLDKEPIIFLKLFGITPLISGSEILVYSFIRFFILMFLFLVFKSKKTFCLSIFVLACYTSFFMIVYKSYHALHLGFYYVLIIFACWLYSIDFSRKRVLEYFLVIVSVFSLFFCNGRPWRGIPYNKITTKKDINIFVYNISNVSPIPYLENNNVYCYDLAGNYYYSFEKLKTEYKKDKKNPKDIDMLAIIAYKGDIVILKNPAKMLRGKYYTIILSEKPTLIPPYNKLKYEIVRIIEKDRTKK